MPQSSLFTGASEAVPESGALFAHVLFQRVLAQSFTYHVPEELRGTIAVGKRVVVPLGRGNRPATGYCVELTSTPPAVKTKSVMKVLDPEPLLTPALLKLTKWMAEYYLCTWGQVLDAVVPRGAKEQSGTREHAVVVLRPEAEWPQPVKFSSKQLAVIEMLRQARGPVEVPELARLARCGTAVIGALVAKGVAHRSLQRVEHRLPDPEPVAPRAALALNPDQLAARAAIEQAVLQGGFKPFLLHGVTGSGKTEVYLQAIHQVVAQGKEALVLVPEISLTPQTIERFRGRFERVAVLHSHLSEAERGQHWRRILAGNVQVVVGARSAVFAPTRRLGLIVVDEEHEGSFKQESTPRYHGRDVAVYRASLEGIPIVLGSATPSLESWHNAQRGQYHLLSLPKRVEDRPLPRVRLVDLRHEPPARGRHRAISPTLERAMKDALDAGGQVMLLLNRRGFATYLICPACAAVVKCRYCDVTMTHHKGKNVAQCHYCGYEQPPPERCPECGLAQIKYLGQGTEKLEEEVAHKFPGKVAARMDSDTMKRAGKHAQVLDAFRRGEVDVLLGTQMIAKGLDFPNVLLVGVVNADLALHLPDFRASERTFQLLAQVAGRTGRGPRGGQVLIQTMNPEQSCIRLAASHDFEQFAALELQQRKKHHYPPFARMARYLVRGKDQGRVLAFMEQLGEAFERALIGVANLEADVRLLGPAEAPLFRLKNVYRYHFQLQSQSASALHKVLRHVLAAVKRPQGIDWVVDVDPLSLL